MEFEDRELLEETLTERAGHKVEIFTPQRGSKRAFLDLVENNAKHAFEQRFRVLKPTSKMIGEAVQNALNLLEEPRRIESFDISHMQGTDTVACMVVWENGRMKKSDYRKFIIRGEFAGNGALDGRPFRPVDPKRRLRQHEGSRHPPLSPRPGRKEAAAQPDPDRRRHRPTPRRRRCPRIAANHQSAARSIAKKEEILYIYGQENEPSNSTATPQSCTSSSRSATKPTASP